MTPANRNIRPFTIYRIICTINGKALISGSDLGHEFRTPENGFRNNSGQWYERGHWGFSAGAFWRTKQGVNVHLLNLCQDWKRGIKRYRWGDGQVYEWEAQIAQLPAPDYSRLQFLRVEQTIVNDYDVSEIGAADFLGLTAEKAA